MQPFHKGRHGAVATNAGQTIGNRLPGTWVTLWGDPFEGKKTEDGA